MKTIHRFWMAVVVLMVAFVSAMDIACSWPGMWKVNDLTRRARRSMWRKRVHGLTAELRRFCWLASFRVKPVVRTMLLAPLLPVMEIGRAHV